MEKLAVFRVLSDSVDGDEYGRGVLGPQFCHSLQALFETNSNGKYFFLGNGRLMRK